LGDRVATEAETDGRVNSEEESAEESAAPVTRAAAARTTAAAAAARPVAGGTRSQVAQSIRVPVYTHGAPALIGGPTTAGKPAAHAKEETTFDTLRGLWGPRRFQRCQANTAEGKGEHEWSGPIGGRDDGPRICKLCHVFLPGGTPVAKKTHEARIAHVNEYIDLKGQLAKRTDHPPSIDAFASMLVPGTVFYLKGTHEPYAYIESCEPTEELVFNVRRMNEPTLKPVSLAMTEIFALAFKISPGPLLDELFVPLP